MDFIVDKAIIPETNPKNIYRLHVVGMSGDADHYKINIRDFKNIDHMLPTFRMMIRGFKAARLYDEKALEIAIEMEGERLNDEFSDYKPYAMDLYSELVGWDVTNDGQTRCLPDEMYITWFNDFGTEHKIALLPTGADKTIDKVTEYNADQF